MQRRHPSRSLSCHWRRLARSMAHVHQMVDSRQPNARCCDPSISERFGVRESHLDCCTGNLIACATMGLREINSDAHADARVTTGRAAGPNRVRIFALRTGGHGETAVPLWEREKIRQSSRAPRSRTELGEVERRFSQPECAARFSFAHSNLCTHDNHAVHRFGFCASRRPIFFPVPSLKVIYSVSGSCSQIV